MRRALVLAVALVAIAVAAPTARADRVSRNQEAFLNDQSQLCRYALGADTAECNRDGYDLSEANVAEYEASDVHRRLGLQRQLDANAPLKDALFPHTHNSYNAEPYTPTLSRLDNNQRLSLTDQLRLDIRAVEIDIHRAPSVHDGRVGVVACHASRVAPGVHAGCTSEEPLLTYLEELRDWLVANPTEFVLLYLENQLEDDPRYHDEAAANIETTIGPLVYRPPAGATCETMPYDSSRAALGKQVLIVGNCGPGAWGSWVHERGPRWDESSNPAGDDYDCTGDRMSNDYDSEITRRYEDRTWLTAMYDSDGEGGGITAAEMVKMVDCGVNLVGFDMLHPDDERLESLVWSWAPGEPAAGTCALQGADGRWVGRDCGERHRVACFDGGEWSASSVEVAYADAASVCGFAAPWNGWENAELLTAGGGEVWVDPSHPEGAA